MDRAVRAVCLVVAVMGWTTSGRTADSPRPPEAEHSSVQVYWSPATQANHAASPNTATDACVEPKAVTEEVERGLNRHVFADKGTADVQLDVRVKASQFSVELELTDINGLSLGVRTLKAASCDELTALVTFTLGIMLDFQVAELPQMRHDARSAQAQRAGAPDARPTPPPSPAPPTPPDPTSTATTEPSVAPTPPRQASHTPSVSVSVRGLATTGLAPLPMLGAMLGTAFQWSERWSVTLSGSYSRTAEFSRQGGQLQASGIGLQAGTCYAARYHPPLTVRLCVAFVPTLVLVRVRGFVEPSNTRLLNLPVKAGLETSVPLSAGVSANLAALAGTPLVRRNWHAGRGNERLQVFAAPPILGEVQLGLVFGVD